LIEIFENLVEKEEVRVPRNRNASLSDRKFHIIFINKKET